MPLPSTDRPAPSAPPPPVAAWGADALAQLAHDLRNALAPITQALHILRVKGASDTEAQQARAAIERQARQLALLADHLSNGAPADADAARAESAPTCSDPRRVLVVDDNHDAADTLAAILRLSGHDVQVAYDGAAALAAAAAAPPDVALLDIDMPGMNGYALAAQLRCLPGLDGALLVALTGLDQESDRRAAAQAGFDLHLTKPADPATLERLLTPRLRPN